MSFKVEIDFISGTKTYGEIGMRSSSERIIPRIMSVSDITRAINKNKTFENSTALIKLNNADGHFDTIMNSSDMFIKGRTLKIFYNNTLIFTGKISDTPKTPPKLFDILADSKTFGFDLMVNKLIKKSDFANVPDNNNGKHSNVITGTATDEAGLGKGILTAYRIDSYKFLTAWHHLKGFESPYTNTKIYDKEGTDITSSCSFDNNADGNAYINYTSTDEEIYFNVEGAMDGSNNLIENPAEQLEYVNDNFGSFIIDGISTAANIYSGRNYAGSAIIINDGFSWKKFLHHFAINFDCFIFCKSNGNLGIKVLDWGTEIASHTIKKMYVSEKTFNNWRDLSKIINEYQRHYWYHFRQNFFQRNPSDVTTTTSWDAQADEIDLRYHRDDATSIDVTARTLFFKKTPIIFYEWTLPKSEGNTVELGDVLDFQYSRGYYPNAWRMVLVLRKTYRGNSNSIFFEGMDITGINDGLIKLWLDTDPDVVLLKNEADTDCHVLL